MRIIKDTKKVIALCNEKLDHMQGKEHLYSWEEWIGTHKNLNTIINHLDQPDDESMDLVVWMIEGKDMEDWNCRFLQQCTEEVNDD